MRCGDAYVPSRLQSENKFPSHDLSQQQEQIKSCKQTAWSFKTISQTVVSFLYSLQNEVQKEFPLQSIAIEIIEGRSLSREQMMKEPQEKNNSRSSNQKKSRLLELLANSFVWRFEREMQLKFTFSTFPRFSLIQCRTICVKHPQKVNAISHNENKKTAPANCCCCCDHHDFFFEESIFPLASSDSVVVASFSSFPRHSQCPANFSASSSRVQKIAVSLCVFATLHLPALLKLHSFAE